MKSSRDKNNKSWAKNIPHNFLYSLGQDRLACARGGGGGVGRKLNKSFVFIRQIEFRDIKLIEHYGKQNISTTLAVTWQCSK